MVKGSKANLLFLFISLMPQNKHNIKLYKSGTKSQKRESNKKTTESSRIYTK